MAIGPGIYFDKYKDYSVDELERELEDLQKYLSSKEKLIQINILQAVVN